MHSEFVGQIYCRTTNNKYPAHQSVKRNEGNISKSIKKSYIIKVI